MYGSGALTGDICEGSDPVEGMEKFIPCWCWLAVPGDMAPEWPREWGKGGSAPRS